MMKNRNNAFFAGAVRLCPLLFLMCAVLFCSGCKNLFDIGIASDRSESAASETVYGIRGIIEQNTSSGAYPAEITSLLNSTTAGSTAARTALPSLPSGIVYTVTAVKDGDGTTVSVEAVQNDAGDTVFELTLTPGSWTISAEGILNDVPVLSGTATDTCVITVEKPIVENIAVTVRPHTAGSGSVELAIGVASGSGITSVKTVFDGDEAVWAIGDTAATFKKTPVTSGSYPLVLSFYGSTGILLYRCTEQINVFEGLVTDTWSGTAPYLVQQANGSYATFSVTEALVKKFEMTSFFVSSSTDGSIPQHEKASDDNTGTYFDPLATLQAAVDCALARNEERSEGGGEYTVFIDGNISYTTDAANPVDMAKLTGNKPINLTVCGITGSAADSLTATNSRILCLNEHASVTVENLTLTKGTGASSTDSGLGGAVYVNGGTFILGSDGVITGCSATYGGAVYVYKGTFEMTGGTIAGNKATNAGGGVYIIDGSTFTMSGGIIGGSNVYAAAGDKTMGNTSASSGGGVYISSSTFTMSGGTISGNTASNGSGGGVYMNGSTFTMSTETGTTATPHIFGNTATGNSGGNGGGVCVDGGTFTMWNSAKVSGNSATASGGGVFMSPGTFEMKGGTVGGSAVYDDTASADAKKDMGNYAVAGGGVYMNGTFNMSDGTIRCNSGGNDGGGVYVHVDGKFTMSDGEIINNSANGSKIHGGGGVSVFGTFEMNGGTISGNTTTTNGGGVWNSGTFKMTGGTIGGNKAENDSSLGLGGGVYVNAGTFAMTGGIIGAEVTGLADGTQITAAKAPTAKNCSNSAVFGGGIYIAGGTVTMTGNSAVAFNYASAAAWPGGGVYVAGGTFNCGQPGDSKPQIYANAAKVRGGGVCMYGGEMNLYGSIRHNYSEAASGGVEVGSGSTVTMYSGASIHDNLSAPGYGGGVHMSGNSNGTFAMTGGSITHNASGSGTELSPELWVQNEQFSMSGDAVVTTTGDAIGVMLPGSATITVGNLAATADGGAQIAAVVACINEINNNEVKAVYTENTPILSFPDTLPADYNYHAACARFKIPNDPYGNVYAVLYDSENNVGVLKKSVITVTLFGSYKLVSAYTADTRTIALSVTDSADVAVSGVTSATIALHQNGMQISDLTSTKTGGTMPSLSLPTWLPAGTYQLYIEVEINGSVYSGYEDIDITS